MLKTLYERVSQTTTLRVDKANARLSGVMLLGWRSANSRSYSPDGVDPQGYVGKPVNAGHSKVLDRPMSDRLGWVTEAWKTDKGIFGKVQLLKSHPLTPTLLEMAEVNPRLVGISHTAQGDTYGDVVRKVIHVESCDVVTAPASTPGLFLESRGRGGSTGSVPSRNVGRWLCGGVGGDLRESKAWHRLRSLTERIGRSNPARAKLLTEMAEDGLLGNGGDGDSASGISTPTLSGPDGEKRKKLGRLLVKILRDENLTLDAALEKVGEVLDDPDKALQKAALTDAGLGDDDTAEESRRPRLSMATFTQQSLDRAYVLARRRLQESNQRRSVPPVPSDAREVGKWLMRGSGR